MESSPPFIRAVRIFSSFQLHRHNAKIVVVVEPDWLNFDLDIVVILSLNQSHELSLVISGFRLLPSTHNKYRGSLQLCSANDFTVVDTTSYSTHKSFTDSQMSFSGPFFPATLCCRQVPMFSQSSRRRTFYSQHEIYQRIEYESNLLGETPAGYFLQGRSILPIIARKVRMGSARGVGIIHCSIFLTRVKKSNRLRTQFKKEKRCTGHR